ncbi:MAG TPA: class I SAM-dependent methyltransferase [Acidiferrobacterales bacterium]|nr:class I SAM-dependent methyltransferase [Acidiferrobacterales bacterium]
MWQNQLVRHAIRRLRERDLPVAVSFWNGHVYTPPRHPLLTLKVNHARALGSLAAPSLGKLATAYVQQQFDIGGNIRDILAVGERLCEPDAALDKKGSSALSWLRHTKPADRKNISYHYDVSNDFYALWLDAQRVYSCAYFKSDCDDLDTAQKQKLDLICRKLMLKPGERVLDVGCGWGALILWAAKHYRAHCLGITLSKDQHAYVKEVVKQLGLEDRVEVRLMDYRDVPESNPFDKIASVGMFEHVGRRNLNAYFGKIWRLLKPGGLVMNHGITATSLDSTELGNDIGEFIEQYVFPGGELVHVARVMESLSTEGLECLDVESLRPHYAKTLWHWVERLEANAEQARQLVGEQKFRIWRIYMAGSALAFTRGWISLFQVLAGKPEGNGSIPYPYRRDHVYS